MNCAGLERVTEQAQCITSAIPRSNGKDTASQNFVVNLRVITYAPSKRTSLPSVAERVRSPVGAPFERARAQDRAGRGGARERRAAHGDAEARDPVSGRGRG